MTSAEHGRVAHGTPPGGPITLRAALRAGGI